MEIQKLYIARDSEQGKNHLFIYREEPVKDMEYGVWNTGPFKAEDGAPFFALPDDWFPNVKWTDERATEVAIVDFDCLANKLTRLQIAHEMQSRL